VRTICALLDELRPDAAGPHVVRRSDEIPQPTSRAEARRGPAAISAEARHDRSAASRVRRVSWLDYLRPPLLETFGLNGWLIR
jgi:hypothetical protein